MFPQPARCRVCQLRYGLTGTCELCSEKSEWARVERGLRRDALTALALVLVWLGAAVGWMLTR